MMKMNLRNTVDLARNLRALFIGSALSVLVACDGAVLPEEPIVPEEPIEKDEDLSKCPSAPENIPLIDIQSTVDWINAMEKPLTLSCFVQSLPRPILTSTSTSAFSAQPARGRRSPRVFFFFNDLIMTVAVDQDEDDALPAEQEKHLLELSFMVDRDALMTTKAELAFPITDTIADNAPYAHMAYSETISVCAFCHAGEKVHSILDGVPIYQSELLKPDRFVGLEDVIWENANCDPAVEPHRCSMLSSVVDHGLMEWIDFPPNAFTLFDDR